MADIKKVAVIGAGVMGAGIAAHVANAGVPVVLLDIVPEGAENRNVIAEGAIAKMLKADPAPFMSKKAAKLITTGNTEDHLDWIKDCDWIVEVVIERLDVKQALYGRIDKLRKAGALVSSNTSTIPLAKLVEGQSPEFAADFTITHFFNPPRYMRLLELVASDKTRPEAIKTLTEFCDFKLGKSVVRCKDRPGFIANRLGTLWISAAVNEAIAEGLEVEEADAVMSRPVGIPKTGIFGLIDLVGLDLMPHVEASMSALLPPDDLFNKIRKESPLIKKMIADGYTGRKGKGGFYRLNRDGGGKAKEAISLATGTYRPQIRAELDILTETKGDLRALFSSQDKAGRYGWKVMSKTLAYAALLVGEAADDIAAIDEAMRLGYNWGMGPFELIDKVGAQWLADKLARDGLEVPPFLKLAGERSFYRVENGQRQYLGLDGAYHDLKRPDGVIMLADFKLTREPLLKNGSAALWDIGDGVVCFEMTSKMNAFDPDIFTLLGKSIGLVAKQYKALVVYNEGTNFSAGANLGLAAFAANIASWDLIDQMVSGGQDTFRALKYAPFPVVSAPSGLALGGGCEILLSSDAIQAHAESYIGLVECGVGLIPGWGGCKEMLARWREFGRLPNGPMPPVAKAFEIISTATVAKSAQEAKELLFLRPTDGITMNRYRLLADAKAKALSLVENYTPPTAPEYTLPGPSGQAGLEIVVESYYRRGMATKHDRVVSKALATILSGGPKADPTKKMSESDILALERKEFMQLMKNPASLARIESVLETGKPLRN
jgi:3-hydroxyacyl-CoA dehydrogenase